MIEANNKLTNQKLENPSAEIRSNSDSVKLLSKEWEESLTVNQDLTDVKIKSIDEAELKAQLRIQ